MRFHLIDRVDACEPGKSVRARKLVSHSEEHLVTSDKGVAMQRRALRRAIETVAAGGDPPGVAFDDADATIHLPSGNYYS